MRLALLADIHGNLPALEAVLAALEALQPDHVVVDGDLINAVPFSGPVVECVRARPWTVVRGNHEFYYLDFGTERADPGCDDAARWGQLHWLVEHITPEQGAWLGLLPDDRTLYLPGTRPLRVTHGVPRRNRVGFSSRQTDEAIAAELHEVGEATLVSAHTHVQVDRHVAAAGDGAALDADPHRGGRDRLGAEGAQPRRWHVVNPGSVGLPLNGDVRAQFALLDSVSEAAERGGWQATMHRVAYDRRPALDAFTTSGMADAGGVITRLFYWELVTAEPELIHFYRWAYANGLDPDGGNGLTVNDVFARYAEATGRAAYIREHDPLYGK
jgi:predicted phosphodiesterase